MKSMPTTERVHFERRYLKLTVPTPAMAWAPFVYTLQTYQKKHITMMKRIKTRQPSPQPLPLGLLPPLPLLLPPDEPLPPKKASKAIKSPKSDIYPEPYSGDESLSFSRARAVT